MIAVTLSAAAMAVAQNPPEGAPPAGRRHEMPDPDKPAGEAFKNVQLLKEVPAGQFFGIMQSISASLGVKCQFCHVDEGNFAADDKEEKKTARAMITMVHGINQQFFNGKMEVRLHVPARHRRTRFAAAGCAAHPGGPGGAQGQHPPAVSLTTNAARPGPCTRTCRGRGRDAEQHRLRRRIRTRLGRTRFNIR